MCKYIVVAYDVLNLSTAVNILSNVFIIIPSNSMQDCI